MKFWKAFKYSMTGLLVLFALILISKTQKIDQAYNLAEVYSKNSYIDTGTSNVVAGIYLDYRLYDSLFEALLLLVTVSAISYLNRTDTE